MEEAVSLGIDEKAHLGILGHELLPVAGVDAVLSVAVMEISGMAGSGREGFSICCDPGRISCDVGRSRLWW